MNARNPFPVPLLLVVVGFAVAHLAIEHFSGGVRSHHVLARPDLPEISNWFGLITLPLVGLALCLRIRSQPVAAGPAGIHYAFLPALIGSLLYGIMLAVSFELGASTVTSAAFLGLFLCAVAFPVYRAEYILGFVIGMTFTFGAVLPLMVALVFAVLSFVVRSCVRTVASMLRKTGSVPSPDHTERS